MSRLSRTFVAGLVIALSVSALAGAHHTYRNDPRIVQPMGVPVLYHQAIVAGYEPLPNPASCGLGAGTATGLTVYSESFESGAADWQFVGTPLATPSGRFYAPNLWHVTTRAGPGSDTGHSGPGRLWFGNEATGTFQVADGLASSTRGHPAGTAQSPPIALPDVGAAVLVWSEKWQTESLKGYDHMFVELTDSSGTIHLLCHSNSQARADPDGVGGGSFQTSCSPNIAGPCTIATGPNPMAWMTRSVAIPSTLAGDVVRVQFTFDSSDNAANWFMGWMIDDVQVVAAGAE